MRKLLLFWCGMERRLSTSQRSKGGWPSAIQWASAMPTPPADWMPTELKPAAT